MILKKSRENIFDTIPMGYLEVAEVNQLSL